MLGSEHLVTDVGSTKAQICAAAARLYNTPERAAFLPGHPMAGKERGGAALGDAELFRGAVWLFTDDPEAQRSPHSAELVKGWREWVAAMGSKTLDLDPARHDELVGWVSHLPQFVATALSALLEEEVGDAPELKDVGGRALREMTRLGASPYSMWRDIAYTNTEAVQAASSRWSSGWRICGKICARRGCATSSSRRIGFGGSSEGGLLPDGPLWTPTLFARNRV